MFKKAFIFTIFCLFIVKGIAQTEKPQELSPETNLCDVQLTIIMSNCVLVVGRDASLYAEITNSSTNTIKLVETGRLTNFDLLLVSDAGKEFNLTPNINDGFRAMIGMAPKQARGWVIPLLMPRDLEPGFYTLNAKRDFGVDKRRFRLVSNSLRVRIIATKEGKVLKRVRDAVADQVMVPPPGRLFPET
jgi:hypothetical protein